MTERSNGCLVVEVESPCQLKEGELLLLEVGSGLRTPDAAEMDLKRINAWVRILST